MRAFFEKPRLGENARRAARAQPPRAPPLILGRHPDLPGWVQHVYRMEVSDRGRASNATSDLNQQTWISRPKSGQEHCRGRAPRGAVSGPVGGSGRSRALRTSTRHDDYGERLDIDCTYPLLEWFNLAKYRTRSRKSPRRNLDT